MFLLAISVRYVMFSTMKIDVAKLPDDSAQLKEMLVNLQGRFDKETGIMLEQIQLLRTLLFGRKSEKIHVEGDQKQLLLFDMPEPEEETEVEGIYVPAHKRKKRGRKPLPKDLPRVDVVNDIDDADKICGCGCELSRIGEEVSEQLDIIPAKVRVMRYIRPKYACKNCEGVEDNGPAVRVAPVQPQIIPKSIASYGLLAHILTGKFVDRTPFYHQEKQLARLGVEVSRTSMSNWSIQAAAACQPLLNLLQEVVQTGSFVNVDETTLQVLKEPGRSPTSKSYMWIFRRGDPDKPVVIFQYHPSRAGSVAKDFLCDFQGYVQTDGYPGYDFLDHVDGIRHVGCWAHSRRKFTDVIKAQGKKRKYGGGDRALGYIRKLYKLEKEATAKGLCRQDVYQMRQDKAKPILDEFEKWLRLKSAKTPPKGLLGKAISYTLKQWKRLVGYVEDGQLAPDNNAAENSIRPFVVGRKNWLFSGTPKGADASALFYSLIETAKANKLEPYAYLRHIFKNLPTSTTVEDYDALLPWNLTPEQLSCTDTLGAVD